MGIENLSSAFLRGSSAGGIQEYLSSSANPGDPAAATAFFEQLAEQIADLKDPVATQTIVDDLNPELIAAASGLPDGNILPMPVIVNPPLPAYGNNLLSNDLQGQGSESPLSINQMPSTVQAGTETIPRALPGTLGQDNTTPPTGSSGSFDNPEIEQSNTLAGELEKNGQNGADKILSDTALITKGEWLNSQPSVRNQPESDKTPVLTMERAVTEAEWKQDLGDRIVWMTRNSMAAAELKLNPPHLGPIEVRINLNQDQMNVLFASQNAAVREAIEAAIPRLREMLGGPQLNLANVDVSHSFTGQHQRQPNGDGSGQFRGEANSNSAFVAEQRGLEDLESGTPLKSQGLLNYYV
ncbi:MAG: flagellar hook-length control protein FliK [Methylococcales bacterium]